MFRVCHMTRWRFFQCIAAGVLATCALVVRADVPAEQRAEVAHLLSFVRYSDCEMIRNGTVHDSREGYQHVLDKYDYFRSRIHSTEDFIDLAATKSLLSGKAYQVDCPGQRRQTTSAWLRAELARYRACVENGNKHCDAESERSQTRR